MPAPAVPAGLIDRAWAAAMKTFTDTLETTLDAVSAVADAAKVSADDSYKLPVGGIPMAALAATVQAAINGNAQGSPTNPWTDGTQRNANLTINYYNTPTDPTAWQNGDINMQKGT